jgi:prepilin-type N-terminal cleavage/methylation domain-containing protein
MKLHKNRGVTLLEMLTVIAIIGIIVLIGLPNWTKVIMMHRIRTSANDLMIKIRYVRSTAIKTRRELVMSIDGAEQSVSIQRSGHKEYDLLQDLADVVSKGLTLGDQYVLYEEDSGTVCVSHWDDGRVAPDRCAYYVGGRFNSNGIDTNITTDCSGPIVINPSGTFNQTCSFTLRNDMLGREYDIKLFKGGQVKIFERLEA